MVFSTNQFRHLFVGLAKKDSMAALSAKGDLFVGGENGDLYVINTTAGGNVKSDLIPVKNITYIKKTEAASMATPLKVATIAMPSEIDPKKVYCLGIDIRQYVGMSDEETYSISAGAAGTSASELSAKLKDILEKNMKKLPGKLFNISQSGTSLVITEVEQEWTLGIKPQEPVYFEVSTLGGWGDVTYSTNGSVKNGKKIADLEYFCMGERGDKYRGINWPDNIVTDYLVNPANEYDVIDIHYFYDGTCEDVQKSEKDLTIVVPAGDAAGIYDAIQAKINPGD